MTFLDAPIESVNSPEKECNYSEYSDGLHKFVPLNDTIGYCKFCGFESLIVNRSEFGGCVNSILMNHLIES